MSAAIPFAAPLGARARDGRLVVQRAAFGAGGCIYRLGKVDPNGTIAPFPGPMLDAAELRAHGVKPAADVTVDHLFSIGDSVRVRPHGEAEMAGIVRGVQDVIGGRRLVFVGFRSPSGWRGAWFDETAVAVVKRATAEAAAPKAAPESNLALWRAAMRYAESLA